MIHLIPIFFVGDYTIYHLLNGYIFDNRLDPRYLTKSQWFIGNLVSYVMLTLLYYNVVGRTYTNIHDHSYSYTFATIPMNLLLTDALFYFMHRLAHLDLLYDRIHYLHHSLRPLDSWVSRASHWVDSNMENVAFTIPFVLIPTYFPLMYALLIFSFFWGSYIHNNGYRVSTGPINGAVEHAVHHHYGKKNYNFAYYFTFWDKLLGTAYQRQIGQH